MVERTPILDTLTYGFLMLGICIVGFPIFYTIVAATLPLEEVSKIPMPLLITTDPDMTTAVIGLQELIPQIDDVPKWNVALAGALLVMLPPILVVLSTQRWFVKGLVEREK